MRMSGKLRQQLWIQNVMFVVLLAALATLIAFFAQQYRAERDLTQNARNTLSQQTREMLLKLSGPVTVTVFALRESGRVEVRKVIADFLLPYQRIKPDI